jgi:hypothetical protein
MTLLARAGADLRDPGTVQAVIDQCDRLVGQLERELQALGRLRIPADGSAARPDPGGSRR